MTRLDRRAFVKTAVLAGATATGALLSERAAACGFDKTAKTAQAAPRGKSVTEWNYADFERLVGTPFDIGGRMLVLEEIRREPNEPTGAGEQFALVFERGKAGDLASGMMPVRHPAIGEAELFVKVVQLDAGPTAEINFT